MFRRAFLKLIGASPAIAAVAATPAVSERKLAPKFGCVVCKDSGQIYSEMASDWEGPSRADNIRMIACPQCFPPKSAIAHWNLKKETH